MNALLITPVSSDVNNLEAFAPNQFLFGNRNVGLPKLPIAETIFNRGKTLLTNSSLLESQVGQNLKGVSISFELSEEMEKRIRQKRARN